MESFIWLNRACFNAFTKIRGDVIFLKNKELTMDQSEIEKKLEAIEKELSKLKTKKKDAWDIFNIIASLLIPASIAFSGYFFSVAMKEAEIRSSEELATRQENIAIISAKVGQAKLIATFIEPLTGDNETKKRVAIRGILIALPEEGPQIVAVVSESDSNEEIQKFAISELDKQRKQLINRAFDTKKPVRITATTELIRGWTRDPKLVPEIIEYATQRLSMKSGIVNTLVILQNVDQNILVSNKEKILIFVEMVIPNGSQTAALAEKVKNRLK